MDNKKSFRPSGKFQKKYEHNINDMIRHSQVRITGDNIESKICSISEAIAIADSFNLDLVEINSQSNPPVCRIVDYGKFLYEKKKKEKENIQNNKSETKEIQLGPNTQEHDLNFKSKHAIKFLQDGCKVKLTMKFRGREMAFKENGEMVMLKFIQMLEDAGVPEFMPRFEGKNLYVTIRPKKIGEKSKV